MHLPRPGLVRVTGRSMEPTLRAGDVLLTVAGLPLRPGSVVVCDLPDDAHGNARPRAVKRLVGPADGTRGGWLVDSDNPLEGVSSLDPSVGPIGADAVVARVLLRIGRRKGIWPLGRVS